MQTARRRVAVVALATSLILAAASVGYQSGLSAQASAPRVLTAADIGFIPNGANPARGSFVVRIDGKWVPMELVDPKIDRTISELQQWVGQK